MGPKGVQGPKGVRDWYRGFSWAIGHLIQNLDARCDSEFGPRPGRISPIGHRLWRAVARSDSDFGCGGLAGSSP
eukprot:1524650-Prymnesium_polylepis.1